jgi:hypothetical protein
VFAEARQVITSIIPHLGVISGAGDSGAVAGTESSAKRALDLITECEGLLLKCDASHTKVGHVGRVVGVLFDVGCMHSMLMFAG